MKTGRKLVPSGWRGLGWGAEGSEDRRGKRQRSCSTFITTSSIRIEQASGVRGQQASEGHPLTIPLLLRCSSDRLQHSDHDPKEAKKKS